MTSASSQASSGICPATSKRPRWPSARRVGCNALIPSVASYRIVDEFLALTEIQSAVLIPDPKVDFIPLISVDSLTGLDLDHKQLIDLAL